MSRLHRALLAGLGLAAVAVGLTFLVEYATAHKPTTQNASQTPPGACDLATSAFLPASVLPGFTQVVNQHLSSAPIKGGAPGATPMLAVTDFAQGRFVGSIANVAIDGPDRAAEDAYGRSLGYAPARIPPLPLSGAVVRDSPGLLEVYEFILVYHSDNGAQDFVRWLSQSLVAGGGSAVPTAAAAGATAYALPAQTAGPNPPYEQGYQFIWRFDNVVLRLAFSGGRELDAATLRGLATTAQRTMLASCPA